MVLDPARRPDEGAAQYIKCSADPQIYIRARFFLVFRDPSLLGRCPFGDEDDVRLTGVDLFDDIVVFISAAMTDDADIGIAGTQHLLGLQVVGQEGAI